MSQRLRKQFIELLEKDVEFRYTVAGYLGLGEILRRLDIIEDQIRKLWEEVRALREGQEKLWEGQNKLWESHNRLWEVHKILVEEVKALRVEQNKLRSYVVSGFRELRYALGVTFEMHAASYLQLVLDKMGYPSAVVDRKFFVHDGEVVEVNLFCEDPLVVGEVTVAVKDEQEAVNEVWKLLKRVETVSSKYGRRPVLAVLSIARASPEAAEKLKAEADKHGFKLILGREIEEALQF